MRISELIEKLEAIMDEHGDLDVETYGYDGSRMPLNEPKIDHRAILKGRESKARFAGYYRKARFSGYYGGDLNNRIGEKVCRL
jgi:hypothetical protein